MADFMTLILAETDLAFLPGLTMIGTLDFP